MSKLIFYGVRSYIEALVIMDEITDELRKHDILVTHKFRTGKPELRTRRCRVMFCTDNISIQGLRFDEVFGRVTVERQARRNDPHAEPYKGDITSYIKMVERVRKKEKNNVTESSR